MLFKNSYKSWAVVLLAILLASVAFGLNLRSTKAQNANLDEIYAPSVARAGEDVSVFIVGDYESSESMVLQTVAYQQSDGAEIGRGSAEIDLADDGFVHHGRWSTEIGFRVYEPRPDEYNDAGEYDWALTATLHGFDSKDFRITIIEPSADPRITIQETILDSEAEGVELDPATDVYVGDSFLLEGLLDYSLPEEAPVFVHFKNNLGIYVYGVVEESDGWVTFPSEIRLSGSGVMPFGIPVRAPLDPVDSWEWQLRVETEMLDGRTAEDAATLTINVQEVGSRIADIYHAFPTPSVVNRGASLNVEVFGTYVFPGDTRGDLEITIEYEDGTLVVGGETHTIPDCSGRGPFDEIITVTAPDVPGVLQLYARLRISGEAGVEDEEIFGVEVTESGVSVADDIYCRITGVLVNGESPPQQVTFGESFMVDVQLEYNLLPDTNVYVCIWDWDMLVDIIAMDGIDVVDAGVTTNTISIRIPEARLPPRNGMWTLRATAYYGIFGMEFTPDGYEQTFQVEIVGADGIAGGTSDWSVTGVWASPVDPFLGTDVAFTARIQVSTAEPLPQTVTLAYSLDGLEVSKDAVTYEDGMAFLSVTSGPWAPTLGEHTIRWEVDPDHDYDDPNRSNNVMEVRFSVSETPLMPAETEPSTEPPPSGEAFDFYVTAVPTEQTISSPVTYTVTVDFTSGTPEPVQLELIGAPAGVSYLFTPPSGTPSYTSTLTITTSSDLPAGTYQLTIKAVGGGKERYKPITLKIEKGPEYTLTISPNSVQAKPGETVTFAVVASSDSGYSQCVNLIVSGLPSGVTYKLEPPASTPPFESTLTLQVGRSVQPGVYTITITGSGADPKRIILTLRVTGTAMSAGNQTTVDYLAAGILAAIVAVIAGVAAYAMKKLRTRKAGAFCIECGTKLSPSTEFCPSCGTKQVKKEA